MSTNKFRRNDKIYKLNINKLIKWIRAKKWDIKFGFFIDEISYPEKIISIDKRFKLENQLYSILHECGHLILLLNKNYINNYPYTFTVDNFLNKNKRLVNSKRYQVELISEEIAAWEKGLLLAKKLKIKLNKATYRKESSKYIWTYIEEAFIVNCSKNKKNVKG